MASEVAKGRWEIGIAVERHQRVWGEMGVGATQEQEGTTWQEAEKVAPAGLGVHRPEGGNSWLQLRTSI